MKLAEAYSLIEVFRETAVAKRREERQADEQEVALDDRKKKHEKHVRQQEERERFEAEVLASAEQLSSFSERLDTYDTATVQALMDNGTALDDLRRTRETLEESAYRLPDGRVVFKSEDGKRILDRHGVELAPGTVDPGAIPDSSTKWDTFKANIDAEQQLMQERETLLRFQARLDAARDTTGKGHVTTAALSDMDDDLRRGMPDAVKAHLPGAVAGRDGPASPPNAPASGAYKPLPSAAPGINGP